MPASAKAKKSPAKIVLPVPAATRGRLAVRRPAAKPAPVPPKAVKPAKRHPRPVDSESESTPRPAPAPKPKQVNPDDHGVPYIRLLRPDGVVMPIAVNQVCYRLVNHYTFIEDEPVIPRVTGDPDKVDAYVRGYRPRRRDGLPMPGTLVDAAKLWLAQFNVDLQTFPGRDDLQYHQAAYIEQVIADAERSFTATAKG